MAVVWPVRTSFYCIFDREIRNEVAVPIDCVTRDSDIVTALSIVNIDSWIGICTPPSVAVDYIRFYIDDISLNHSYGGTRQVVNLALTDGKLDCLVELEADAVVVVVSFTYTVRLNSVPFAISVQVALVLVGLLSTTCYGLSSCASQTHTVCCRLRAGDLLSFSDDFQIFKC